jgi:hypothetical protein
MAAYLQTTHHNHIVNGLHTHPDGKKDVSNTSYSPCSTNYGCSYEIEFFTGESRTFRALKGDTLSHLIPTAPHARADTHPLSAENPLAKETPPLAKTNTAVTFDPFSDEEDGPDAGRKLVTIQKFTLEEDGTVTLIAQNSLYGSSSNTGLPEYFTPSYKDADGNIDITFTGFTAVLRKKDPETKEITNLFEQSVTPELLHNSYLFKTIEENINTAICFLDDDDSKAAEHITIAKKAIEEMRASLTDEQELERLELLQEDLNAALPFHDKDVTSPKPPMLGDDTISVGSQMTVSGRERHRISTLPRELKGLKISGLAKEHFGDLIFEEKNLQHSIKCH